jgi:hypothetical protein
MRTVLGLTSQALALALNLVTVSSVQLEPVSTPPEICAIAGIDVAK